MGDYIPEWVHAFPYYKNAQHDKKKLLLSHCLLSIRIFFSPLGLLTLLCPHSSSFSHLSTLFLTAIVKTLVPSLIKHFLLLPLLLFTNSFQNNLFVVFSQVRWKERRSSYTFKQHNTSRVQEIKTLPFVSFSKRIVQVSRTLRTTWDRIHVVNPHLAIYSRMLDKFIVIYIITKLLNVTRPTIINDSTQKTI